MIVGKMPPPAKKIIDGYEDEGGMKRSAAEWGLRWVWNHPEVGCVLSGMNEDAQVTENVRVAADATAGSLSESDLAMIGSVRDLFHAAIKVDCTGCAYCMPCPYGVNIPSSFACYNSWSIFGGITQKFMYAFSLRAVGDNPPATASQCKSCGACEKKCPQHIPIMASLKETAKHMESPLITGAVKIASKFMG
jgi:predicted aldo/keto reductase-like oxidoreductase